MSNETKEVLTYSNPRKTVDIPDWPTGNHKTRALFEVETKGSQQRAVRTTWHPTKGFANKPKKMTYAAEVVFVDGSDGRLYVLEKSPYSDRIDVWKGTFDYTHEYVTNTDARYEELRKLFDLALAGTK